MNQLEIHLIAVGNSMGSCAPPIFKGAFKLKNQGPLSTSDEVKQMLDNKWICLQQ